MSNIADKITKLIAKAESSTHPEEADAFMAKAHQMLQEHGMSLQDLGTLQSEDPVGRSQKVGEHFASESAFRDTAGQLARYYGCEPIYFTNKNHRWFDIVGRESARVTYTLMWPYIKKRIRMEARRLAKETPGTTYARQQRYVADALTRRIRELTEVNKPDEKESTGANALVPVDIIAAEFDKFYPNTSLTRRRTNKTTSAAQEAAAGINLNAQMGGGKARAIGNG